MSKIGNYAEYIASLPISKNIPNEETLEAMREAESGKELETLDISSLEAYIKSLEDIPG